MSMTPAWSKPFSAWQWAPLVRDGRVVWVVEKTSRGSDGRLVAWRLEQVFDSKRAAMNMAGEMNNGLDWTDFPMMRVTDGVALRKRRRSSGVASLEAAASGRPRKKVRSVVEPKPAPDPEPRPAPRAVGAAPAFTPALAAGGDGPTPDDLRAALAARGGLWTFVGLYSDAGRVPARLSSSLYGGFWKLRAAAHGRWNIPAGPSSRVQRELDLYEADEIATAVVKTRREKMSDGSVRVRAWIARAGCPWGTDAVRVAE